MQNLQDYLSTEYSWWVFNEGDDNLLIALDAKVKPTAKNLRIIFPCPNCGEYHVAKLKDIKIDDTGDYNFCCPEYTELGEYEGYISLDDMPECLEKIFKEASFEKNY